MFKRILVPVDMRKSETAERALEVAATMAQQASGELVLMTMEPATDPSAREIPETAADRFQVFVEQTSKRLGLEVSGAFRYGDSLSAEIREVVGELEIDLVAMASHDPRLLDYLTGSNAASVALHTPCSVLVVR